MADPLSIAASVTGLLAVAGKISTIIYEFVSGVADAPESARAALATVGEMRLVLNSIQEVLSNGLFRFAETRRRMVHISRLVLIFRESIISFSELEAIMSLPARTDGRPAWSYIKWRLEEGKIARCIQRLESNKTTLSAMLSILHCESDFEAQQHLLVLQNSVQLVSQQNQAILHRFEQANVHLRTEDVSVRFLEDDMSTIRAHSTLHENNEPDLRLLDQEVSDDSITAQPALTIANTFRDFENALNMTRVYRRVRSSQCDVSFNSSAVRSHAWSVLSDLSLNDVSVISVVALPISQVEINLIGANLTFSNMYYLTESQEIPEEVEAAVTNRSNEAERAAQGKLSLYKLVVLGHGGTGKSALTIQLCLNHFVETYDPTIEESYRKQVQIDNQSCILEILDTAGDEEYTTLRDQWIRDGDGFIIMYSISSRSSFVRVQKFYNQVITSKRQDAGPSLAGSTLRHNSAFDADPPPMILAGSKCDRVTEREVSTQEGVVLAKQLGCPFLEISAKHRINVEPAFYNLVRMIRKQRSGVWKQQVEMSVRQPDNDKERRKRKASLVNTLRRMNGRLDEVVELSKDFP